MSKPLPMKLTNPQMKVIGLMQQGWTLFQGCNGRAWLQKTPDEVVVVRWNTFSSLWVTDLIKGTLKQYYTEYSLTAIGKAIKPK